MLHVCIHSEVELRTAAFSAALSDTIKIVPVGSASNHKVIYIIYIYIYISVCFLNCYWLWCATQSNHLLCCDYLSAQSNLLPGNNLLLLPQGSS